MQRELILITCILYCLWLSIRRPFVGVLAWTWIALMQPYTEVSGYFSSILRINLIVAIVCILTWFFSRERKIPPMDATIVAILMFLVWATFNTFLAIDPSTSWNMWDRVWRIMALGLLIWATANNKIRIHALIWVVALSLLYYGVKAGFVDFLAGGQKKIAGALVGMIADNNNFAVALLMTLPLVNYLRIHTANTLVRLGLTIGLVITLVAILGTYSRGALLALGALAIIWWVRSRNKLLYVIFAAAVAFPIFNFMPAAYYARLSTMNDVDSDVSFQGRLVAWKVAFYYARDHFPIGAGFDGIQNQSIFDRYFSDQTFHAAHSIFFQVLGDNGFVGLAIYLVILFLGLFNCSKIRKATRNRPELAWARDLATMIQLSLIAFCVGGAALSLAYYDMLIIWVCLLPPLWNLVKQTEAPKTSAPAIGMPAFASRVNEREQYASTYPTPGKV